MTTNITIHVSRVGPGCKVDKVDPPSAQASSKDQVAWTVEGDQGNDTVTIHSFRKNAVPDRPLPQDSYDIPPSAKSCRDWINADAKGTYKYKVKTPHGKYQGPTPGIQAQAAFLEMPADVDPEIQIAG